MCSCSLRKQKLTAKCVYFFIRNFLIKVYCLVNKTAGQNKDAFYRVLFVESSGSVVIILTCETEGDGFESCQWTFFFN